MGHRLTADMSKAGKVKRAGGQSARQRVSMHYRHVCRSVDVDPKTGLPKQHSFRNKDIDPTRTHMNEVWVNDSDGGFKSVESLDEVMGVFDRYMEKLDPEVTVRKDAVYSRGAVLNLDDEWWAQHNPNWKTEGLNDEGRRMMDALLDCFVDEVGQEHVATAALHMDEYVPQWQVGVIPVVDGRLSSDKVIPSGSKEMTAFHQRMRQRMTTAGHDIEMQSSERSTERLSLPTIKKAYRWMDEVEQSTGVRPDLPSPTTLLDQAVAAAMSNPHVFDEASFDEALKEMGVERDVDSKTGGTVYSMDNPFYDPDDEEDKFHVPRIRRAASKLSSKPTAKVVAQALAQKKVHHGQAQPQLGASQHAQFSTVEHVDSGAVDERLAAARRTDRAAHAAAERDLEVVEVDHDDAVLDELGGKLDDVERRREAERKRRAAQRAKQETDRRAQQAHDHRGGQRGSSAPVGREGQDKRSQRSHDDGPDF